MAFDDTMSDQTTVAVWRGHFSWLPQRPHLFNTTLAENLRLGAPDASDEELRRVLGAVGLDDLLANLPGGLATIVGHDGLTLSSGERRARCAGTCAAPSRTRAPARRTHRCARPPDRGAPGTGD